MSNTTVSDKLEPRRISNAVLSMNIDGYLMPVDDRAQPILVRVMNEPDADQYVTVFSTIAKLDQFFADFAMPPYASIKAICAGGTDEFVASLAENQAFVVKLRLMVDPYRHVTGTVRYLEIPLDGTLPPPTPASRRERGQEGNPCSTWQPSRPVGDRDDRE